MAHAPSRPHCPPAGLGGWRNFIRGRGSVRGGASPQYPVRDQRRSIVGAHEQRWLCVCAYARVRSRGARRRQVYPRVLREPFLHAVAQRGADRAKHLGDRRGRRAVWNARKKISAVSSPLAGDGLFYRLDGERLGARRMGAGRAGAASDRARIQPAARGPAATRSNRRPRLRRQFRRIPERTAGWCAVFFSGSARRNRTGFTNRAQVCARANARAT